jgi:hypothetical protein
MGVHKKKQGYRLAVSGHFHDPGVNKPHGKVRFISGGVGDCTATHVPRIISVGQIQGGPLGDLEDRLNRIFSILVT